MHIVLDQWIVSTCQWFTCREWSYDKVQVTMWLSLLELLNRISYKWKQISLCLSVFIALPTLGASFQSKVCFRWRKTTYYKFDLKVILNSCWHSGENVPSFIPIIFFLLSSSSFLLSSWTSLEYQSPSFSLNPPNTFLLNVKYSLARCCEYGMEKKSVSAVW